MRRTLTLLLLILIVLPVGAVLESCALLDKDDCNFSQPEKFFDVQTVMLDAVRVSTGQNIVANETLATNDVRLEIRLQVRYYSLQLKRSGWVPAAVACPPTPLPGYAGTSETLDSLVVRSTYAYDATHPAGSSLNDLLISSNTGQSLPLAPERGSRPALYSSQMRLRQGPAQAGPQQFVLRYRLTNGEIYVVRTPVFELR